MIIILMVSFKVYIHGREIRDGELLPFEFTQEQPEIKIDTEDDCYAAIMVDPDAPSKNDPKFKYWLHWLVLNNNESYVDFHPPAPPKGSGEHRYYFLIYKQARCLDLNALEKITIRSNFSPVQFANKYYLTRVGIMHFRTTR